MKRLLAVAVVGCLGCGSDGGGGSPSSSSASNRLPVTPSITQTPTGVAIVGTTRVSFNAATSDPDGDALTYTWSFGDGSTGAGAIAEKIFSAVGTFNVTATINDGKGGTATATTQVTVKSLTGSWTDVDPFFGVTLTQTAATVNGKVYGQGGWGEACAIENGVLSDPRNIRFFRRCYYVGWVQFCNLSGTVDPSGDRITVKCAENDTISFNLKRD